MKENKLRVLTMVCLLISAQINAQTITTPRTASPAATVSQTIGISTVTVNYSRPSVKGREIWGNLVPYGWNVQPFGNDKMSPWRAGANENTVITFSDDATLQGKPVPKGSYGLYFVINADNSGEVILSKDYKAWGHFFYEPGNDLFRAPIQIRDNAMTETLTYEFSNISKNSAELALNWEKKRFPVKIEFAVDNIVMANAAAELKGAIGFQWQGYNSAANYALQNKVNLDQALAWSDRAVTLNKAYATLKTRSGLLALNGNPTEADKVMEEAVAKASENELNLYGYQLISQGQLDKAIKMLELNTQRFPKSANTWDSLGEAQVQKGDNANAIKNFKKSLSLNPPAATKANSEKYLKQLNAL